MRCVQAGTGSIAPDRIVARLQADLDGLHGRQVVMPMTCSVDGYEHAVSESRFLRGVHGRYRALCGSRVVPGSLSEAPGRPCPVCLERQDPKPIVRAVSAFAARWDGFGRTAGRVRGWARPDGLGPALGQS